VDKNRETSESGWRKLSEKKMGEMERLDPFTFSPSSGGEKPVRRPYTANFIFPET
jgi:hypothetical protein